TVTGTFTMPSSLPAVSGTFSRVFLNAAGDAIGSVSADGKTVSLFNYDASNKLISIDQYAQTVTGTFTMPSSLPAGSGTFSRVFLNAAGDAIGSVSADGKTVSKFNYDASNKLVTIDQFAQNPELIPLPISMPNVSGAYSRVFLNAAGDAIGSVSVDGK